MDDVKRAVANQDVVLHNAAYIPPYSEVYPEVTRATNIGGTRNVIAALQASPNHPRLVYSSSAGLFGSTRHLPPPRTAADPVQPSNHYTASKAACEELVRSSGLIWTILRFGATPPLAPGGLDRLVLRFVFAIPLDTRVHFVHTHDVGLALANAAGSDEISGKILLIGGGSGCRLYQREFIGGLLEATGVGRLPDAAYGTTPFCLDWMDTTESQQLLQYQRHTFDDFLQEMAKAAGIRRHLARAARPLVRAWMLRQSPFYRAAPGAPALRS
jgi:nucleoside-diphosphate-sugar epimerase